MGIPIIKIRWVHDCLIFVIGIPICANEGLYTEMGSAPDWVSMLSRVSQCNEMSMTMEGAVMHGWFQNDSVECSTDCSQHPRDNLPTPLDFIMCDMVCSKNLHGLRQWYLAKVRFCMSFCEQPPLCLPLQPSRKLFVRLISLPLFISLTVECHYNAVQYSIILHTSLQQLKHNITVWTHKRHSISRPDGYEVEEVFLWGGISVIFSVCASISSVDVPSH